MIVIFDASEGQAPKMKFVSKIHLYNGIFFSVERRSVKRKCQALCVRRGESNKDFMFQMSQHRANSTGTGICQIYYQTLFQRHAQITAS